MGLASTVVGWKLGELEEFLVGVETSLLKSAVSVEMELVLGGAGPRQEGRSC